jgi:hypothetical protein
MAPYSRDQTIKLINHLKIQNRVCCSVFCDSHRVDSSSKQAKHGIARDFIYTTALAKWAAQVAWRTESVWYDRPLYDEVVFIREAFTEDDTSSIAHPDW